MNTANSHSLRTRSIARAPLALALAAALGIAVVPAMAVAATYTVTSAGDAGTGTCAVNSCTLRDAVAAATSGSDTIMFASSLSGDTITLSGNITISHSVTIQGLGANRLTVSGGSAASKGGIFYLNASYCSLTVSGITLANGNATYGGALGVHGFNNDVTLSYVALENNHANSGGGGFYTPHGTVTVTHSTISGNSAGSFGGGIDSNYGAITVIDSTISGNSAGSGFNGSGGGIYVRGPLTVNNSTISGNSSQIGSGFELNAYSGSVTNSIVSGNSNFSNQFQSTGQGRTPTLTVNYSLINGSYYVGQGATFSGSHLITGQDPMLGPLADNGGPTQTMALLYISATNHSPAIDAGSNADTSFDYDQRGLGFPRIFNGKVDIGAFEYQGDRIFVDGFEPGP